MTNFSLRAGLIGSGFISPVHLEALRRLGITVTTLCDLPDRAAAAAARLGIPRAVSDYRVLVRSPEVEVVHITSPNRFHRPMALAALRAGKHVVCEKPLALNSRETSEIVAAAHRAQTVFAVNYNVRFYPAVLAMRDLVHSGQLGDIIHVNGSYFQDWLFKDTDYNWRLLPREGGPLRAVADIGTHWMDTVSFVLGSRIAAVFAQLGTHHRTRQRPVGEVETFSRGTRSGKTVTYRVRNEDFASVLLRFQNQAHGNLAVSQVAAGRKNSLRFELYGSRQSAAWDSEKPETLWLGRRDEANQVVVRNSPAFGDGARGFTDYPAGHVEGFPDTFKMLFRAVYARAMAPQSKEPVLHATPEDGHHEVAVCEAILRSHRARAWATVRAPTG